MAGFSSTQFEFAVNFTYTTAAFIIVNTRKKPKLKSLYAINLFWHEHDVNAIMCAVCAACVCVCGSGLSLPVAWPIAKNDISLGVFTSEHTKFAFANCLVRAAS